MNKNYCVINLNDKIDIDVLIWEMCVKSDDGDVIYPTNIYFECKNVCEALEMCKDHISVHKKYWKKTGCVRLEEEVTITKKLK